MPDGQIHQTKETAFTAGTAPGDGEETEPDGSRVPPDEAGPDGAGTTGTGPVTTGAGTTGTGPGTAGTGTDHAGTSVRGADVRAGGPDDQGGTAEAPSGGHPGGPAGGDPGGPAGGDPGGPAGGDPGGPAGEGPGGPAGGDPGGQDGRAGAADGDAGTTDGETGKPRGKTSKAIREITVIAAAAVVLTVLIKLFVIQVYEIPSPSMENTLLPGDRVLVNKLIYHFRHIDRGDVVVFSGQGSWGNLEGQPIPKPPGNPVIRAWDDVLSALGVHSDTTYYIKRVIGLPGDKVACCTDGDVTVNGVKLHETSYLYPGDAPSALKFHVTVPAGKLWVMGDHRGDSSDSRWNGPVPENKVVGRAFWRVWPLSRFGSLPIPATFKRAALSAAGPLSDVSGLVLTLPAALWLRRRRKRAAARSHTG